MGGTKRKSRKKPPTKKKTIQALDTVFDCVFCCRVQSCDVRMDRTKKTGRIQCVICQESFQTAIHSLSEPIDVYNDWIDACEKAN